MKERIYFVKAKLKNGDTDKAYYHVCYSHEDAYEVYQAMKDSGLYRYVFIHRVK